MKAQLEDLALTLRDYEQKLDASPERLQEVEDRLALIERLKRKHGPTLDDVLAKTAALSQERDALDAGPAGKEAAEAAAEAARPRFLAAAPRLSAARRAAAPRLRRRAWSTSWPSWPWPAPASSCGWKPRTPRRRGTPAASTAASSSSPPTSARRRGRWPASPRAASCRG